MEKLFNFMCMCFGKPPEKFDFEYKDSNKESIMKKI